MTLFVKSFYCLWLKNKKPLGLDGLKKGAFCNFLSDRITFLSKPQLLVFFVSHLFQRIKLEEEVNISNILVHLNLLQ